MNLVFWLAGAAAIISAAIAVNCRSPMYATLYALVALGGVAVEFALMHSPFLAAMQILLYAGAIMVLFVFVIMLLSLKPDEHGDEPGAPTKVFALFVSAALFVIVARAIGTFPARDAAFAASDTQLSTATPEFGSVAHFGHFLYGTSLVPFELASVLLTAAVAAVLVLARKRSPVLETPPPAPAGDGPHGHAVSDAAQPHQGVEAVH
jgi:NADH-quinone oxidoreductase subunit J